MDADIVARRKVVGKDLKFPGIDGLSLTRVRLKSLQNGKLIATSGQLVPASVTVRAYFSRELRSNIVFLQNRAHYWPEVVRNRWSVVNLIKYPPYDEFQNAA